MYYRIQIPTKFIKYIGHFKIDRRKLFLLSILMKVLYTLKIFSSLSSKNDRTRFKIKFNFI